MKLGSIPCVGFCVVLVGVFVPVLSAISWADSGSEKILYNFTGGSDQSHPSGRLVFDKSGHLYGTTSPGGNGPCGSGVACGTVFELSLSNGHWVEKPIYTFCSLANCADGDSPQAGVIFDSIGNLYGTTMFGGDPTCNCGTVFQLTQSSGSWTYHVLHTFKGSDGANPEGGITLDSSGRLYGTTIYGGINGEGTVFRLTYLNNQWTETVLHSFPSSATDGMFSLGELVVDKSGNVYGTTEEGGQYSDGTVFELSPAGNQWNEIKLVDFSGPDGIYPAAGLIADKSGNLYGTTPESANYTYGTVFELIKGSGTWTESVLYTFTQLSGDGAFPSDELLLDSVGNLFGTTEGGGVTGGNCYNVGCGTVFELSPTNSGWREQVLYSFTGGIDGTDGYDLFAPLTTDNKGHLIGTTVLGGTGPCSQSGVISGCGIIFKVTPNEIFVPVSVAFPGIQLIGTTSKSMKVAFTYSGPGTLTLNSLTASANFGVNTSGITANACNLSGSTSLGTGKSCYFNLIFAPTAIGSLSGDVVASYSGDPSNSSLSLPLNGKGTAISVPPSLNFGTVAHGQQSSQPLTITNASTTTTIHVLSYKIGGTNATSFSVTNNPCASIAPGGLCQITVRFAPATIGSYVGSIQLKTDAGSNPTIKLLGSAD